MRLLTDGGELRVLTGADVADLLQGREAELIQVVKVAYQQHASGASVLPHSSFLRIPESSDRIIALPAYLRGRRPLAGLKWIASFPGNVRVGIDRASAVVVLNDPDTGSPFCVMEGSLISARRTAASAVLAGILMREDDAPLTLSLVGCGLINFEVCRFMRAAFPELVDITVYDIDADRADFLTKKLAAYEEMRVSVAASVEQAIEASAFVSIATTATKPHLDNLDMAQPGAVFLHLSLRDISLT
jgi:ornithine cyclodeaminase